MALPLTKLGRDVFAPVTAGGNPRGADMGEASVLTTEYEKLLEALVADAGGITLTDDVIYAINSGTGTANAVQAVASSAMSTAPGAQLITVNFTTANTGPMTLKINDDERPLVTNTGAAIETGYISAGMSALVQIDSAGNYRLFSYGDATAIQAAAEAAQAAAEAAAEAAQNAVPNSYAATRPGLANLPSDVVNAVLKESGFFGDFELVNASDYADLISAGAVGEVVESTTDLSKAWVRRRTPDVKSVDFKAFGAVGGSTNDTPLWNALVARLSSSTWDAKEVIVPPGDFTLHQAKLASNMAVKFIPGSRILQPAAGSAQTTTVFDASGTLGTGYALASNSPLGAEYVSVSSGVGTLFTPGQYALVQDDDYVFVPAVAGRNQEIVRVLSVTSITVAFDKPLTTGFTTANNAKIYLLTPLLNLRVSGEGEVVIGNNQGAGFKLTYGVNSGIERGLLVRNARGGGSYWFNTCFNTHLREVSAMDAQSTSGGTGYGISMNESCTFCTAESNHFENLRENTYTNRTRQCTFRSNNVVKMADTGWNTHGAGCDYNICENNDISYAAQAVAIGWSGATRADSFNIARDNRIKYCINGVSIAGKTDGSVVGAGNTVLGNTIENLLAGAGITASQQQQYTIANNQILRSTLAAHGINAAAGVSAGDITGNIVDSLSAASAIGIRVSSGASYALVAHNTVRNMPGATALSYYVPSGATNTILHANTDQSVTGRNLSGAPTEKFNSWN